MAAQHAEQQAEVEGRRVPWYMYMMAACAALNSTNMGFDLGVGSGLESMMKEDLGLSDAQIGGFLSTTNFVAAFGGLCSNVVIDRLGRRLSFTVGQAFFIIGLVTQMVSSSFPILMFGRVLVGLGIGLAFAIDYLYIAELAPASHRGSLVAWAEVAINVGSLIGNSASRAFSDSPPSCWRWLLGFGLILPTALTFLSLFVMPETPRHSLAQGKSKEAGQVLRRTHPEGDDIDAIVEAIEKERQQDAENDKLGWAPVLCPDKSMRRAILVGIGVAFAQQINASESVMMYAPTIYERAHLASDKAALFNYQILTTFFKMLFVVIGGYYVDRAGRRPMLIGSVSVTALCLFGLSVASAFANVGWLAVVSLCVFMAAFSIGIGPVTWMLCAEMFPSSVRGKAMSLGTFVNRGTSGLIVLTYLPLTQLLGSQALYYAVFGVLTALSAVYIYILVPETKGLSLEASCHTIPSQGKDSAPADIAASA